MSRRELRPSNADRVPYEDALGQAYADGRLDLETYGERMQQVAVATSSAQLEQCVSDVPFSLHTDRAVAERSRRSRRWFLGAVGMAVVTGGTFWATRQIPEPPAAVAPPTQTPTPTSPPERPTDPGQVATTMAQVPVGTSDSFPILAQHLTDSGVTSIHRIQMSGEFVTVEGLQDSAPVRVTFRTDWAPTFEPTTQDLGPLYLSPADVAGLDAAELIRATGELLDLGDQPHLDLRWFREQWLVAVRGADEQVYWDLDGMFVVDG